MRQFAYLFLTTVVFATSVFLTGCGSSASSAPALPNADHDHNHDDHGHNHDDDNCHDHDGPNHAGHDHDGVNHAGHDHDGVNHAGHSHDGDNHDSHAHSHEHGDTGPHGGHLIELGRKRKYHAELVENDAAETVTVYILDAHLGELAISGKSIYLNLATGGETTAYEMVAAGDGQSANCARFESTDKALFRVWEHGEVTGKLRVTIEGVPYVGRIALHDHLHDNTSP